MIAGVFELPGPVALRFQVEERNLCTERAAGIVASLDLDEMRRFVSWAGTERKGRKTAPVVLAASYLV